MLLSSCIRKSPGKIKDPSTGLAMLLNLRKIASSIVELASTPFSGLQPKIKRKLPVFGSSFTSSSSYTPSPSRNSSGMSSLHALKMASTQQFFFDARPLIYFSKGYFILRTSSSLHMTKWKFFWKPWLATSRITSVFSPAFVFTSTWACNSLKRRPKSSKLMSG